MIRPALVQARLDDLYLCPDLECRTVSNDSSQCPRCHSTVLSLAAILNHKAKVAAEPETIHAHTH
jgi:hypothetical protein